MNMKNRANNLKEFYEYRKLTDSVRKSIKKAFDEANMKDMLDDDLLDFELEDQEQIVARNILYEINMSMKEFTGNDSALVFLSVVNGRLSAEVSGRLLINDIESFRIYFYLSTLLYSFAYFNLDNIEEFLREFISSVIDRFNNSGGIDIPSKITDLLFRDKNICDYINCTAWSLWAFQMAHEIAHGQLNHENMPSSEQERDADILAAKTLFKICTKADRSLYLFIPSDLSAIPILSLRIQKLLDDIMKLEFEASSQLSKHNSIEDRIKVLIEHFEGLWTDRQVKFIKYIAHQIYRFEDFI